MVLRDNFFVEQILPKAVLRTFSAEEIAEYRQPFAEPGEGRRPTLTWVRQIPTRGSPPMWLRSQPTTRTCWRRALCSARIPPTIFAGLPPVFFFDHNFDCCSELGEFFPDLWK
jgi:hypothetical protein